MTKISSIISSNKTAAISAAVIETGRMANNKALALIKPKLPMMARGYADTAFGKLAIANAVQMAASQFKPDSTMLARVANGMVVAAYQEVIQSFNIEDMLDDLMGDTKVAKAFTRQQEKEDE
jgi:hypothetical protein